MNWYGIAAWIKVALRQLQLSVYPPRCIGCGVFCAMWVCQNCRGRMEHWRGRICLRCGQHLRSRVCSTCRRERFPFLQFRSLFVYRSAAKDAICRLKYGKQVYIANVLGSLLGYRLRLLKGYQKAAGVVPIPISWRHRLERGFNQSELLGEQVSRILGIPLYSCLRYRRHVMPQSSLRRAERHKNMQGAFLAKVPLSLVGKRVILVDDVLTTGSTAREATYALLEEGIREIWVATVARSKGRIAVI